MTDLNLFTTETAGLPEVLGPDVTRLADGDRLDLRIGPVRKNIDGAGLRMLDIIQGEPSVSTPRQRCCSHVFYGLVLVQAVHVTTKEPACDIDSSPPQWPPEPHSPCSPAPPWRRRRPGQ